MKMSQGEEKIVNLLRKGKYKFEREKRFRDLKHGLYRFDFYVRGGRSTPCVIEFNGAQHYVQQKQFQPTVRDFKAQQERDRRKISYCLAHHIPIYIIPYWELDKITIAADLFKPKYRAKDRWKNDRDWWEYKAF
jgi:hypothetical protein